MAAGFAHLYFHRLANSLLARHGLPPSLVAARRLGQCARPLPRHAARRMLEPARIAVITCGLILAYLEDGEHAAHLHRTEGTFAGHHRHGVIRQRHLHLGHIGHAALAHHHVIGDQLGDAPGHVTVVHPHQGRHIVAHGVHGVMALVAMQGPVALLVGDKLQLAHLPHRHIGSHLRPARAHRGRPAIGAGHLELVAMHMNRVVGHGQVAHAQAHPVVVPHHQRVNPREDPAVEGPQIEVEHLHDLRRVGAGLDVVGAEQEAEVAVHLVDQRMVFLGVGDPEAHHAHGHLHHLVGMGVIHKGAGAAGDELVNEGFAHRDRRLVQPCHAVHAIGQALAVPVDAGVLGQFVGDENAHPVALHHLDGRPRRLAVVAPQVSLVAGRQFAHHRLCNQVEFLDSIVHAPRQGPAVKGNHRVIGPPAARLQRRLGVGAGLQHRLGQGRHSHPADRRSGHRRANGAGTEKEIAS